MSSCECVDHKELNKKLYPEGATELDIKKSNKDGYTNHANWLNKSKRECKMMAKCSEGYYFNKLACKCFSNA